MPLISIMIRSTGLESLRPGTQLYEYRVEQGPVEAV